MSYTGIKPVSEVTDFDSIEIGIQLSGKQMFTFDVCSLSGVLFILFNNLVVNINSLLDNL